MFADRVIVATGSSPLGHQILKGLGHTIVNPVPSLFSFIVKENKDKALSDLAGASVSYARIKLLLDKDFVRSAEGKALGLSRPSVVKALSTEGPLLITHQGLSGPAVLRLSSFGARVMASLKYQFDIEVKSYGLSLEGTSAIWPDGQRHSQSSSKIYNTYATFLRMSSSIDGSNPF